MKNEQKEKYRLSGLNIAYYRKLHGYTQEQFAEALDIDRTTVSKVELATSGISLDLIIDMSDLLQLPVNKIFEFRN